MYTPEGRTGRTPERLTRVVAAVAVALMGLAGVAAAAPKGEPGPPPEREPGPPPQAQPNGLPDQAQPNGLPPQAQDPEPAPQGQANGHGRKARGAPAEIPRELPPQAGGHASPRSAVGQSQQGPGQGGAGHHGRPQARGPSGQEPAPSNAAENGGGNEQSGVTGGQRGAQGGVLGVSEERPGDDRAEPVPSERQGGGALELGSAVDLNSGGAEDDGEAHGGFDSALPFTGFELALLAGVGALLGLAGVRLRRSTA